MLVATNAAKMMRWMARWTSVDAGRTRPAVPRGGSSSDLRPSEHLAHRWLLPG
jgi:hypothetical protein